jgi:hypothetical protein
LPTFVSTFSAIISSERGHDVQRRQVSHVVQFPPGTEDEAAIVIKLRC